MIAKSIQFLVTSKRLYPLWRNGYIERAFFLLCRALLPHARPTAFNRTMFGFDFSRYQGVINFAKVFAYGAKFLILRAVYGKTQDERFAEYAPVAVSMFPLAAYAFYDPVISPQEQANKVISVIAPYKNKIRRVWLDLEFWWDGAYKDPRHWKVYRDTIKAAGYQVGWYTRKTWWDSRVGIYAAEFGKDPLWAAQYSSALTLIPNGWNMAMLWQSGTPAIEVGTQSAEVDLDIWNDDFVFELEWDGAVIPPPGGTMDKYMKATDIVTTLNVRSSGQNLGNDPVTGNDLGAFNLTHGDIIHVVEANTNYYQRFDKLYRNDTPVDLPSSPTGQYWARATDGVNIWLIDTVYIPPQTWNLPPVIEHTAVFKDDAGRIVATYQGTLTKK